MGKITQHKARFVANSTRQIDGVDYQETFAPAIKLAKISLIFSIAIMNNWEL